MSSISSLRNASRPSDARRQYNSFVNCLEAGGRSKGGIYRTANPRCRPVFQSGDRSYTAVNGLTICQYLKVVNLCAWTVTCSRFAHVFTNHSGIARFLLSHAGASHYGQPGSHAPSALRPRGRIDPADSNSAHRQFSFDASRRVGHDTGGSNRKRD